VSKQPKREAALDPTTLVIAAYGYARERGDSRSDAFMKAVRAYCAQHPDFPAHRAGAEVAHLLLAAARSEELDRTDTLPRGDEMEYVGPA
jgi:hypothetical protein